MSHERFLESVRRLAPAALPGKRRLAHYLAPGGRTDVRSNQAATAGSSQRLAFLDGLRGIAAISVFLYHAGFVARYDLSIAIAGFVHLGNFGVILFFLCSGFIIPLSLERQGSLGHFWIRRILRMYPLYWVSIALYVALAYGLNRGESVDALQRHPVPVALANMTMFQLLFDQPSLNYGYWTLLFEMLFYFIASVLFRLGLLRRTGLIACGMCLAAIVVEAVLPLWFGIPKPALGIIGYLSTMFLGTVLYRVHTRALAWRPAAAILILGALMLASTALTVPAHDSLGLWGFRDYLTARIAALGVFVSVFAVRVCRTPRILHFLGQISYSVYLLHMAVILLIGPGDPLLTMAIWLLGTLLVATLSYFYIERPAILLGRRLTITSR